MRQVLGQELGGEGGWGTGATTGNCPVGKEVVKEAPLPTSQVGLGMGAMSLSTMSVCLHELISGFSLLQPLGPTTWLTAVCSVHPTSAHRVLSSHRAESAAGPQ